MSDPDLEKMMDDLAGTYGSGPEEEQEERIGVQKDSRNAPLKARAKQKRFVGNNRHEDNRRLDGSANIIEEASKAILQNHRFVTIEESKEILHYDNGLNRKRSRIDV